MIQTTVMRFPYKWTLADANFTKDRGKVFSCFSCGGGSTMGYKLAGFDVIGCCEIDPRMMAVYQTNHHPKYAFTEAIQDFKLREDLPEELYHLDILDGSPPCSTFSISGSREEAWGKKKKFREGQAEQVLDTLFFDFIDLAEKLRPKIVIAENVKGLLMSNARAYVTRILHAFDKAGYYVCHHLLKAAKMGVPQKRERVFFLAVRKDLAQPVIEEQGLFGEISPVINLNFNERPIPFSEIMTKGCDHPLPPSYKSAWDKRKFGDIDCAQSLGENKLFNGKYIYSHKVANTVTARENCVLFDEPRHRNDDEIIACSSWPTDYGFGKEQVAYICGMSVPPVMMARVADAVGTQWLEKIKQRIN